MCRLIEAIVRSGLTIAWRFANWPTSRSPVFVKATTDGVVRLPSAFGMTTGWPPSIAAMTEFVVPRSMPTTGAAMGSPCERALRARARRRGLGGFGAESQLAARVLVVDDDAFAVV